MPRLAIDGFSNPHAAETEYEPCSVGASPLCHQFKRLGAPLMARIAKKAGQDGTFTVYLESEAVAWGLTSSAADALIKRLKRVSRPVRWIA